MEEEPETLSGRRCQEGDGASHGADSVFVSVGFIAGISGMLFQQNRSDDHRSGADLGI